MERLGNIIADQVGSYLSLDEGMKTLRRKCETLLCLEVDVNTELVHAESSCAKKRRKIVENWLANVEMTKNEVRSINEAVVSECGVLERVKLASQVENLTKQVGELLEEGKFSQGLTLNTHDSGGIEFITKPLVGKAFQENLEKVWRYLMEPEVLIIGIWGMGGVGKTTLVTHINNQARQQHYIFDDVCWITVSQNMDIHKLQDKFAKVVNMRFDEEDERKRAAMLSRELKRRRFLFILDDVWRHIDLDRVGIHVQVNGCKLIITTRSLDVCRRLVCQETIKVKPLSDTEAWDLFEKNLGHEVALSPQVMEVASCVARECAGLPLGIITVAGCMREVNDVCEWRDALRTLSEPKDGLVEMEEEVFHVLKFSYNRLNDPKLQQSFLYCALYPEDHRIEREDLVQRLIDEGVIGRMGSMQSQFDRGHAILNKLVNFCLLEKVVVRRLGIHEENAVVKVHDLLRDMAINMMRPQYMVKAGIQLCDLPDKQEWSKDVEKISLMHNRLKEVSAGTLPWCPNLSSLLLSDNRYLERIENSFFEFMPALQILDLSSCGGIEDLPDSLSNLKNLIALVLRGCWKLQKLPTLAKLTLMKRLDLYNTGITEAPEGLERLSRLIYLDFRAQLLEVFPTGILPQMHLLEFLKFHSGEHRVKIKGEELKGLERLSTFEGNLVFEDAHGFKSYVMSKGFKSYLMSQRTHRGPNCSYRFILNDRGKLVSEKCRYGDDFNTIRVKGFNISKRAMEEESIVDVETLEALLKDVPSLELDKCYGARNLCDVSWLDNATQGLKRFQLSNCGSVQCLVQHSSSSPHFLQNLEKLTLESLQGLEVLIESGRGENGVPSSSTTPPPLVFVAAAGGAFSSLKDLYLTSIYKIKVLFHPSFLTNLRNLQKIWVDKCEALEEIIASSDSERETNTSIEYALPNLTTLTLYGLPQLTSICAETISCPCLSEITVVDCPQLKRMSLSETPSSFRSIWVHPEEWWESAQWDHPNARELLQPYLRIGIPWIYLGETPDEQD